jgi:hypothetical protein
MTTDWPACREREPQCLLSMLACQRTSPANHADTATSVDDTSLPAIAVSARDYERIGGAPSGRIWFASGAKNTSQVSAATPTTQIVEFAEP